MVEGVSHIYDTRRLHNPAVIQPSESIHPTVARHAAAIDMYVEGGVSRGNGLHPIWRQTYSAQQHLSDKSNATDTPPDSN